MEQRQRRPLAFGQALDRRAHGANIVDPEQALVRQRRLVDEILRIGDIDRYGTAAATQTVDAKPVGDLVQPGRNAPVRLPGLGLLP